MLFDSDVQKAVNEPRVHNQFNPNTTFVEGGFDEVEFLWKFNIRRILKIIFTKLAK